MTPAQQQLIHLAHAAAARYLGCVLHDELAVDTPLAFCSMVPAGHPEEPMFRFAASTLAARTANTNTPAPLSAV